MEMAKVICGEIPNDLDPCVYALDDGQRTEAELLRSDPTTHGLNLPTVPRKVKLQFTFIRLKQLLTVSL